MQMPVFIIIQAAILLFAGAWLPPVRAGEGSAVEAQAIYEKAMAKLDTSLTYQCEGINLITKARFLHFQRRNSDGTIDREYAHLGPNGYSHIETSAGTWLIKEDFVAQLNFEHPQETIQQDTDVLLASDEGELLFYWGGTKDWNDVEVRVIEVTLSSELRSRLTSELKDAHVKAGISFSPKNIADAVAVRRRYYIGSTDNSFYRITLYDGQQGILLDRSMFKHDYHPSFDEALFEPPKDANIQVFNSFSEYHTFLTQLKRSKSLSNWKTTFQRFLPKEDNSKSVSDGLLKQQHQN